MTQSKISNEPPSAPCDGQLIRRQADVGQFSKRLSCMASSTAQSLYAIAYIGLTRPGMQTLAKLARNIYALAAVLAGLREDLIQCGEQEMWNKNYYERLLCSMRECEAAFRSIIRAVGKADKVLSTPSGLSTRDAYIKAFTLDDECKMSRIVVSCHDLALQTILLVRYEFLARRDDLDEDLLPETLRLALVFKDSVFRDNRVYKNWPVTSEQLQKSPVLSQTLPVSPPGLEEPDADPNQSADPLTNARHLIPREPVPIWAYNQWPPFGDPQHPAYLAAMGNQPKAYDKMAESKSSTASLSLMGVSLDNSQGIARGSLPSGPTTRAALGLVSFEKQGATKPESYSNLLFTNVPSSISANHNHSGKTVLTPVPHLEAYVLRPMAQATDASTPWSYETESLRIDEEAIQTYMHKMEPTRTVVELLVDLASQESRLVQLLAKQRNGNIVSVQYGKPIGLMVQASVLWVNPIIFVIKTASVFSQEDQNSTIFGTMPVADKSLFINSSISLGSARIFGSNPGFDPNRRFSSARAYSQYLQEQGEPCTYVEGIEGEEPLLHYQTITTNRRWQTKDRSLEEIRLADYEAGRRGPMKTNGIFYPWEMTSPKPGFGFGDRDPTKSSFSRPASNASFFPIPPSISANNPGSLHTASTSRGPFYHIAPNMPPFVPPGGP